MSDYTQITDFSAKDALTTGDPEKIILGADLDAELSAISTAVSSKYDSDDIASEAQAEALALDTVLLTPLQLANVMNDNAGMVGDIQALADPNVDTVLGWDDSAGAVIGFTLGTGITSTAGGAIELDFLGLEDLTDPGADRIAFWDDSLGALTWLVPGAGLDLTGTTLSVPSSVAGDGIAYASGVLSINVGEGIFIEADTLKLSDQAVSTTQAVDITDGVISIDITSLTQIEGNALAATDEVLIQDGSVLKAMRYQDAGLIVNAAISTAKTFTSAEMNQVWQLSGATDQLWDVDTGVGVQGNFLILIQTGAGQIDLSGGTATINNASSHNGSRTQSSVIFLICTAANTWYLYGDTATVT